MHAGTSNQWSGFDIRDLFASDHWATTGLTMITTFFLRYARTASLAAAVLIVSGFGSSVMAQSVAAMVNGEAITNFDIEQRIKLTTLTTRKTPSRQEALEDLINDKVKIREGKKYGLDMSSTDIDGAFGNMASRMRMNSDQLVKTLEGHGIRPDTLKLRIKADMTWGNLVRGRFQSSFLVPEKDLAGIGEGSGDKPETESFEYLVRPIVAVRRLPSSKRGAKRPNCFATESSRAMKRNRCSAQCATRRYAISSPRPRPICRRTCANCSIRPPSVS